MLRTIYLLCFCLFYTVLAVAQSPLYSILDSTGATILLLQNGQFTEANTKQSLVNVKGNLIFKEESDLKEDIIIMVKAKDLFKKQIGEVLTGDMKKVLFTTYHSKFYLGGGSSNFNQLLVYFEQNKNEPIELYHGVTNSLLATIVGGEPTTGELTALVYLLNNAYHIDEDVLAHVPAETDSDQPFFDVSNTSGTIRKLWGPGQGEYIWDGRVVKRKWNPNQFEEWVFDGITLERAWLSDNQQLVWDGEVLKRKWYSSPDEFEYDGSTIKRRYGPASEEFIIQGNIVKRMWGDPGNNDQWQIDGEIPIPIIILVVYGLVRK